MTPRENFSNIIQGENHCWLPFTLDVGGVPGFSETIQALFNEKTGKDDPAEYFDYDFRIASVSYRFGGSNPQIYHKEEIPENTTFDAWGIGHWAGGEKDTYEKIFSPFAHIEKTHDVYEYPEPVLIPEDISEKVRLYHNNGYQVIGYAGSVYEWSWWLRGMEKFLMDLVLNPEIARAIIEKVAYFTKKLALKSASQGIDILAFYDDAGMQSGMQLSPEMWRQFIKPAWANILESVKEYYSDTTFFLHSCGNISAIIPDIVELGFHILHPVQPECMNPQLIKQQYGNHIILCGTLGAQNVFSFGTIEEVKRETENIMNTLGADSRCIICPSNIIQPETPWENILVFAETARSYKGGKNPVIKHKD